MSFMDTPTIQVTGNRSCYVKIGDVTIYLDHTIERQPVMVDAWTGDPAKRMPINLGRATLDLETEAGRYKAG